MAQEKSLTSTISNLAKEAYVAFANLFISILVTSQLGVELKGEYNSLKLVTTLYAPILLLGYANGVMFNGLRKKIDLQKFFWVGFIVVFVLSIPIVFILNALIQYGALGEILSNVSDAERWLMLCMLPFVILNIYNQKVLNANKLFKAANIRIGITTTFLLAFYVITYYTVGSITLSSALLGVLLSHVLELLLNMIYILGKLKIKWPDNTKGAFMPWNYGIKVWSNLIIAKLNDKTDLLILSFLMGPISYGWYVVGVSLSNMASALPNSYIAVVFTRMVGKKDEDMLDMFYIVQRFTFALSVLTAVGVGVSSIWLIPLMYGEEFRESVMVSLLYMPGLVFQIISRLNTKFYAALGKPLKNAMVYLTGIIVSIPFFFILVPRMDIQGAAISSSIAYFASYLFSHIQLRREYNVSFLRTVAFGKKDIVFWKGYFKQIRSKN